MDKIQKERARACKDFNERACPVCKENQSSRFLGMVVSLPIPGIYYRPICIDHNLPVCNCNGWRFVAVFCECKAGVAIKEKWDCAAWLAVEKEANEICPRILRRNLEMFEKEANERTNQ